MKPYGSEVLWQHIKWQPSEKLETIQKIRKWIILAFVWSCCVPGKRIHDLARANILVPHVREHVHVWFPWVGHGLRDSYAQNTIGLCMLWSQMPFEYFIGFGWHTF